MNEQDMQPLCDTLRAARRAQGMTQSELAKAIGCAQSAISMFESGRTDALAWKVVRNIAQHLHVTLPDAKPDCATESPADLRRLLYCPIDDCPSNIPYVVRGQLHFKPTLVQRTSVQPIRCTLCGEILEDRCPNPACSVPLVEGSACFRCGTAYVSVTPALRGALDHWVARRREDIRELWSMSRAQRLGA